jgi:hypothetical protein
VLRIDLAAATEGEMFANYVLLLLVGKIWYKLVPSSSTLIAMSILFIFIFLPLLFEIQKKIQTKIKFKFLILGIN